MGCKLREGSESETLEGGKQLLESRTPRAQGRQGQRGRLQGISSPVSALIKPSYCGCWAKLGSKTVIRKRQLCHYSSRDDKKMIHGGGGDPGWEGPFCSVCSLIWVDCAPGRTGHRPPPSLSLFLHHLELWLSHILES